MGRHSTDLERLAGDDYNVSDNELFRLFTEVRDEQALRIVWQRHRGAVRTYLLTSLHVSVNDVEDVLQETFMKIIVHAAQFDTTRAFHSWLYTIAKNASIDFFRKNKRHTTMDSLEEIRRSAAENSDTEFNWIDVHQASPFEIAALEEERGIVRRYVSRARADHRVVIESVFFQHLKYIEAAEALQMPIGTVKSRIHAGVAKLTDLYRVL